MAYNVYLYDLLNAMDFQTRSSIYSILQGYFDRVAQNTSFHNAFVHWADYDVTQTIANHELLIYFLPSGYSVISDGQGSGLSGTYSFGSHWGATQTIGGRTASEVYMRTNDPTVLANLAFHEAMHNKLRLGNQQLHNGDGMRGSAFVSAASAGGDIDSSTLLTSANIMTIAPALGNPVPQWTDGISILLSRRRRRDANDPTWFV
jgi:hypothetical protein